MTEAFSGGAVHETNSVPDHTAVVARFEWPQVLVFSNPMSPGQVHQAAVFSLAHPGKAS